MMNASSRACRSRFHSVVTGVFRLTAIPVLLCVFAAGAIAAEDCNDLILEQVNAMPSGGKYSVSRVAKIRLQSAAHFESGKFFFVPSGASPSFCSGATYL